MPEKAKSVRSQILGLGKGERITFPLTRASYVRSMLYSLSVICVDREGQPYKFSSAINRDERIITVTRLDGAE